MKTLHLWGEILAVVCNGAYMAVSLIGVAIGGTTRQPLLVLVAGIGVVVSCFTLSWAIASLVS